MSSEKDRPAADLRSKLRAVMPEVVFVLVAVAFAAYFAYIRMGRPEWKPVEFEKLVAGTALAPMQYRALIPCISGVLMSLELPFVEDVKDLRVGFEISSLVALAVVYRVFLGQILKERYAPHLCALLLFLVLPYNYALSRVAPWYYVYDLPSVLFFTAGLLFLYRRQWIAYYLVFAIGTFNRETTCFLTVVWVCTGWGRVPFTRLLGHCIAQAALWLAIKGVLVSAYGPVEGGVYINTLGPNLQRLVSPRTWLTLLSTFGYLWVPLLFLWRWIDDVFVRRACLALPILALGMLAVGVISEVRIYGEFSPLVLTAYVCILRHIFQRGLPT